MPRHDLSQQKFEQWLARGRAPMKRGACPLTNFCGRPVGRGLIYGSDIEGVEAARLPAWAVNFSYYVDGMDGLENPRIPWALRSVAASTVRRVYRDWKAASPEVLSRLARARALDESR
jgi:hypothetical protein